MIAFDGTALYDLIRTRFRGVPRFAAAMSAGRPRPLSVRTVWAWVRGETYRPGFETAAPSAHDLARAAELLGVEVGAFFSTGPSAGHGPRP